MRFGNSHGVGLSQEHRPSSIIAAWKAEGLRQRASQRVSAQVSQ